MLLNYLILLPLKEEQIIKKVKQTFQIQRRLAFSTKMARARPAARHESCRSGRARPTPAPGRRLCERDLSCASQRARGVIPVTRPTV